MGRWETQYVVCVIQVEFLGKSFSSFFQTALSHIKKCYPVLKKYPLKPGVEVSNRGVDVPAIYPAHHTLIDWDLEILYAILTYFYKGEEVWLALQETTYPAFFTVRDKNRSIPFCTSVFMEVS